MTKNSAVKKYNRHQTSRTADFRMKVLDLYKYNIDIDPHKIAIILNCRVESVKYILNNHELQLMIERQNQYNEEEHFKLAKQESYKDFYSYVNDGNITVGDVINIQ